jgi:hypothetical protein
MYIFLYITRDAARFADKGTRDTHRSGRRMNYVCSSLTKVSPSIVPACSCKDLAQLFGTHFFAKGKPWRLKQCKNCSQLTWALTQTVPPLKSPACSSPSSHLCSPFNSPSTHPRLDGPTYAPCSSPAHPPPKPGPKIGNTQ